MPQANGIVLQACLMREVERTSPQGSIVRSVDPETSHAQDIVTNSPALLAFIAALQITLSKPQGQHALNVVDGLIVGEGSKTLSAL